MSIRVKRVYDPPSRRDGHRVLVDRVWPRGVSKEAAQIAQWLRDIAPSTKLRQWFGHDPVRWDEFRRRYFRELSGREDALRSLRARARKQTVTLVFGAKDEQHNNAVALKEYLQAKSR